MSAKKLSRDQKRKQKKKRAQRQKQAGLQGQYTPRLRHLQEAGLGDVKRQLEIRSWLGTIATAKPYVADRFESKNGPSYNAHSYQLPGLHLMI